MKKFRGFAPPAKQGEAAWGTSGQAQLEFFTIGGKK